MLERTFGKWRANGDKPAKNIAEVPLPATARTVIIDRPGSPQSLILAGHVAPPEGAPNNIAIEAMNEIIGGNFNARVNMNLRESKGWAYGAYTFFQSARGQRPWLVYAPVQTDKTGASIAELKKELKGFLSTAPATADELQRVKLDNVRSLPGQFETSGAVLGSVLSSLRFGRPLNYPETLPGKYGALSTADANAAAREVIHPDQLIWVIIGDAAKIRAEVEAAGIGQVEVRSINDL